MKGKTKSKNIIRIPITLIMIAGIIGGIVVGCVDENDNIVNSAKYIFAESTVKSENSSVSIEENDYVAASTTNFVDGITFSPDGDSTWGKEKSVSIEVKNMDIATKSEAAVLYYCWSTSSSTPSISEIRLLSTLTLPTEFSYHIANWKPDAIFNVTGSGLSGKYYLHVLVEQLDNGTVYRDLASSTTPYYFDNTNPTVGTMTMKLGSSSGTTYINDTWAKQPVYISLNNGTDAHTSCTSKYKILGNTYYSTAAQTLSDDGTHKILVETSDSVGNTAKRVYTVKIDKTAPTSGKMTINGTANYASGTKLVKNTNVALVFSDTATDGTSGIKQSYYTIYDSFTDENICVNNTAYLNGNYTLTEEGEYSIAIAACDNAGNYSSVTKYYVDIDKTAPKITLNASNATVTATASDSFSGIAKIQYSTDNSAWTDWSTGTSATKTLTSSATVYARAIDNAGNVSAVASIDVTINSGSGSGGNTGGGNSTGGGTGGTGGTIDTTSPTCTIAASESTPTNASSIKYTFIFDEDVTEFTEEDVTVINGTKGTFTETSSKQYTLEVTNDKSGTQQVSIAEGVCEDLAGNINKEASISITVDRDAPNVEVTAEEEQEWTKTKNVEVIITDTASGLADVVRLLYGWSESNTTGPASWKEVSITGHTSGTMNLSFTANGSNMAGKYYLWIKPVVLQDALGNVQTTQVISNETYWFKDIESIEVSKLPNKTEYNSYEKFDSTGIEINAVYNDGSKEVLSGTDYQVINETYLTCLIEKIEIQYKQNSEIKTYVQIEVEHAKVVDAKVEATCTKTGLTEGAHCEICKIVLVAQEKINELGHSFTNYVTNNDATCTKDGTKTAKCDRCDETHTATDEGSALGHNYESKVTAPTCTEGGNTTHTCTTCKDEYVDAYTNALGHSFTNYVSNNDATCTEDGTKTAKCDRCEEIHTVTDEGSALGHNYESKVTAPTCTEGGYTNHTCTRCKDEYVDTYTNALGHNYENGICTGCGDELALEISTEKYSIRDSYITKVQVETTAKQLKENLQTNATQINIYNKNQELLAEDDVLATGMKIELKLGKQTKRFKIVVAGDINGDGKIKLSDMSMVNRHRLKKITLEGEYLIAADVNEDGKVDFRDLVKINRFRLNKIIKL